MTVDTAFQRELLFAFAELLDYPFADPAPAARRCGALLERSRGGRHVEAFLSRAEGARPHEMEELYAATFDFDTACAPYVGHHLCGDTARRGAFLARLADVYREDGFTEVPSGELPDHLPVVLRYLAAAPPGPKRDALLVDGLIPALDGMLASPLDTENAYRSLLAALREEVQP